jgi:hypothetical protein
MTRTSASKLNGPIGSKATDWAFALNPIHRNNPVNDKASVYKKIKGLQ